MIFFLGQPHEKLFCREDRPRPSVKLKLTYSSVKLKPVYSSVKFAPIKARILLKSADDRGRSSLRLIAQ